MPPSRRRTRGGTWADGRTARSRDGSTSPAGAATRTDAIRSRHTGAEPAPPRPGEPRKDVEYKGAPLDAERGPGLGCFWLQVVALAVVVVLTPLSAAWEWPTAITIVLLATTLVLLLFVGQTIIFLLRLVAADRRATGRRRPMGSRTPTVGEIEDEAAEPPGAGLRGAGGGSPDEWSRERDDPG